jgi:hypothetical protein
MAGLILGMDETETIMPDLDLAVSVRNYARNHGGDLVSSAWLANHFGVDPRTIAASLRPYGVAPAEVERGVRGYAIADLTGMVLPDAASDDEVPVVVVGRVMWCAVCNSPVVVVVGEGEQVNTCHPPGALLDDPVFDLPNWDEPEPDAISRLSAGAGHDMTPALRAAGLL